MVAPSTLPGRATGKEAARQLRRLGFPIRLKLVPQDSLFTRYCGVPRSRVAICPTVGWFKDFHDAESMLRLTFHGAEIRANGNVNWSQLRVPSIDQAIDAASQLPLGPDRDAAWGRVNHDIAAQAPGAPIVWDDAYAIAPADLDAPMNPYTTTIDLSFVRPR
jgi:peptide/nickel transport system substrate-binding protein